MQSKSNIQITLRALADFKAKHGRSPSKVELVHHVLSMLSSQPEQT